MNHKLNIFTYQLLAPQNKYILWFQLRFALFMSREVIPFLEEKQQEENIWSALSTSISTQNLCRQCLVFSKVAIFEKRNFASTKYPLDIVGW